jgi:tripartite-type tricarboxylate transporter receptor subunit TctC
MHRFFNWIQLLLILVSSIYLSLACAQEKFPNKPVTLVVPQAPGGANDAIARVVGQKLSELTGQSFVV